MDVQENTKDKKDTTEDKETELDESTDSADSVVKVNGGIAKVDVVTKETEPESVTNRKADEGQGTPENKTIDTENKDKVIENKEKTIENKEKTRKLTEPEPEVKSNAVANRDPAVIDHVNDDVTQTQLLSHQRPLVSTTLLDSSHPNLTPIVHNSLDILLPLLLHVDIDDDDDDYDEEESIRNMESFAESDIPLYSSIYSSAVSKITSSWSACVFPPQI